jgi:hypothetical protein
MNCFSFFESKFSCANNILHRGSSFFPRSELHFRPCEPHFSALNILPVIYALIYALLREDSSFSKFYTHLIFC